MTLAQSTVSSAESGPFNLLKIKCKILNISKQDTITTAYSENPKPHVNSFQELINSFHLLDGALFELVMAWFIVLADGQTNRIHTLQTLLWLKAQNRFLAWICPKHWLLIVRHHVRGPAVNMWHRGFLRETTLTFLCISWFILFGLWEAFCIKTVNKHDEGAFTELVSSQYSHLDCRFALPHQQALMR